MITLSVYDCGIIKLSLIAQITNLVGRREKSVLLKQKSTGLDRQIEGTKLALSLIESMLETKRINKFSARKNRRYVIDSI